MPESGEIDRHETKGSGLLLLRHTGCGFQFEAVPLAIIEGNGMADESVTLRQGQRGGGVQST